MDTKNDVLEIKWPWTLMPIECVGDWIKEIKKGLKVLVYPAIYLLWKRKKTHL